MVDAVMSGRVSASKTLVTADVSGTGRDETTVVVDVTGATTQSST